MQRLFPLQGRTGVENKIQQVQDAECSCKMHKMPREDCEAGLLHSLPALCRKTRGSK